MRTTVSHAMHFKCHHKLIDFTMLCDILHVVAAHAQYDHNARCKNTGDVKVIIERRQVSDQCTWPQDDLCPTTPHDVLKFE
jgi:hypothetical protein